jgi:YD repeat-containing protein
MYGRQVNRPQGGFSIQVLVPACCSNRFGPKPITTVLCVLATLSCDGVQSWVYGGDNRPISMSLTSPTLTSIQAGINALGQRVLKTVNTSQATIITRFMYDESGRLVGEYDLNGAPIQETIWFNDFPVAVLK